MVIVHNNERGSYMLSDYIISTNSQKILKYLSLNSGKFCYNKEIARNSQIGYGLANRSLNNLYKDGLLHRKIDGKKYYYSIDINNPFIKEFKILNNILIIEPLVKKIKKHTYKIVLYGSWASGTDTEKSDIYLYIVSSKENIIRGTIDQFSAKVVKRKIQAIIKPPEYILENVRKDKVFWEQIKKGKILWDKPIDDNKRKNIYGK